MVKIILEGPDNAGKSTLARYLHETLQIPIVPGEGPAKSEKEINDRVMRYNSLSGHLIFDRHPCVSQPIYNHFRQPIEIDPQLIDDFYEQPLIFVYCRGRATLDGHEEKAHDDHADASGQHHLDLVNQFHPQICVEYDRWALERATISYRIGDPMRRVHDALRGIVYDFDPVRDIAEFHMKFGLQYDGPARTLPRDMADFRKRFMDEELDEYAKHEAQAFLERYIAEKPDVANYSFHLDQMLDALVDETYVVLGTAYLHGFKFKEAWRRVHEANMKKIRAERATDSKRGSVYDVVKPLGWEAPSHIDLVEQNDIIAK